jgi:pyridinium-3,5-biscarboxylic acid mononucleotide synthase
MTENQILDILKTVAVGDMAPSEALNKFRTLPYEDMHFAKVDTHRVLRKGYPETIFCDGKTPEQIAAIAQRMRDSGQNVLGTRCSSSAFAVVHARLPDAVYHEVARTFTITREPPPQSSGTVAIVCAGTSDIPVAEEAAVTCTALGSPVDRIYDVGVAGLHRLLGQQKRLDDATVVIVCAGMEGALPSVVAGLVSTFVIAVPTSIGYGASFNGLAALLGMLNSCATGLTVVNIDNGFGAAVAACTINRLVDGKSRS